MKTQSTFTNWDFDDVWVMDTEGDGYPGLQWYLGSPGLSAEEKAYMMF